MVMMHVNPARGRGCGGFGSSYDEILLSDYHGCSKPDTWETRQG